MTDALLLPLGPLLGSDSESNDALGDDATADEVGSDEEEIDLASDADSDGEADTDELPVELESRKLDKAR